MPWHPEHKQQTRERILLSAAKLFTRDGYENVSINNVMTDAGLTRGAFYSHFATKSELYAEAIETSARQGRARIEESSLQPLELNALIKGYLSQEHRRGELLSCPLAFLITDISQRDDQVRDTYTRVFKGFVNNLCQHQEGEAAEVKTQALQTAVMMIGGVAIARAINDDQLAEVLLEACQQTVLQEPVPEPV
ncbi:TetR/AcrR family transcriptional regulator [Amphritea sp. HPY]|uniref:TetR/AcrR family transcriptional regulator n=1 Tax=Amphritea sp. HPY TaxID=3421652 RepID=UPI003D7E059E